MASWHEGFMSCRKLRMEKVARIRGFLCVRSHIVLMLFHYQEPNMTFLLATMIASNKNMEHSKRVFFNSIPNVAFCRESIPFQSLIQSLNLFSTAAAKLEWNFLLKLNSIEMFESWRRHIHHHIHWCKSTFNNLIVRFDKWHDFLHTSNSVVQLIDLCTSTEMRTFSMYYTWKIHKIMNLFLSFFSLLKYP